MHADGADVVTEDAAQMVVRDLAEIGRPPAEAGHARRRVGRASAGSLDRRAHRRIKMLGAVRVDQVHRALDDVLRDEEILLRLRDDVDDGVADRQHVETRFTHIAYRPFLTEFAFTLLSGWRGGWEGFDIAKHAGGQVETGA